MSQLIPVFVLCLFLSACTPKSEIPITDFDSCVAAGNPVMESYPPRCNAGGQTYTQNIGNELEFQDQIQVSNPRPNQTITSPLTVTGQARGPWYFEASFPVVLQNSQGTEIATAIAQAQGDWMTEDFVPYTADLIFPPQPPGSTGTLILKKANPSGSQANDQSLVMPVRF